MKERWRPVVGYGGLYEVSSEGRVRSLDKHIACGPGSIGTRFVPGRLLSQQSGRKGHLYVGLYKATRANRHHVAALVLAAFVGKRPSGKQATHDDGIPTNNCLGNLAWKTCKQNHADRDRHGTTARGERSGVAVLTKAAVVGIRTRYARGGITQAELGEEYGVTQAHVSSIVLRQAWAHV